MVLHINVRGKKDYFTSALPDSQRGPEVTIPLTGGTLDVTSKQYQPQTVNETSGNVYNNGAALGENGELLISTGSQQAPLQLAEGQKIGTVDLSKVSPIGIIALRNAFKLQQFLERNNIAGGRYIESILAHFGVLSPDRRLQRPAYLGGFFSTSSN